MAAEEPKLRHTKQSGKTARLGELRRDDRGCSLRPAMAFDQIPKAPCACQELAYSEKAKSQRLTDAFPGGFCVLQTPGVNSREAEAPAAPLLRVLPQVSQLSVG